MMEDKMIGRRRFIGLSALAAGSLMLAGCGNGATNAGSGDAASTDGTSGAGKTIRIGWIPWDECIAVTYLWKNLLEDKGYTVELTQADAGPVYQALGGGDIDLYMDAWLPVTHEDYMEQYGEKLEDLVTWYDNALLTWAVPEYMDVTSIADLKGMGDELDGRIVGIEPGAGLTRLSKDAVIPGYGLDGEFSLIEGSTTAMLAELDRATKNEEPIVVTLWRPHWAYNAFPVRDLEDPEGHLGEAEIIKVLGREGFKADHAEVAGWMANLSLTDAELAELGDVVINQYGTGQEEEAIEQWLSDPDNRALADSWMV